MRFVLYSLTQRVLFHALRLIGAIDIREMMLGSITTNGGYGSRRSCCCFRVRDPRCV